MGDDPFPLPTPDPVAQPFWDSLKAHAMTLQRCADCGLYVYYPRAICPACRSRVLIWTPVSGRGVVHAFTIPYRHTVPAFAATLPFVVALIELEEGARILSNVIDVEPTPEAVKIGMPVEIVYDDVTDEITLPRFRPR